MPAATSDLVPHHIARLCACGAKLWNTLVQRALSKLSLNVSKGERQPSGAMCTNSSNLKLSKCVLFIFTQCGEAMPFILLLQTNEQISSHIPLWPSDANTIQKDLMEIYLSFSHDADTHKLKSPCKTLCSYIYHSAIVLQCDYTIHIFTCMWEKKTFLPMMLLNDFYITVISKQVFNFLTFGCVRCYPEWQV